MPNAIVSCLVFPCVSYYSISFSQASGSSHRGRTCNLAFSGWKCQRKISVRAVGAIEKESVVAEKPVTFLRDGEGEPSGTCSVRARFEKMIRKAQDNVCTAVEAVDGHNFREDVWSRPGGGGGISRVLQDGNVWEKAGVNVSVVYGNMPPEAYRAAKPISSPDNGNRLGPIPFFAAGISSIGNPIWEISLELEESRPKVREVYTDVTVGGTSKLPQNLSLVIGLIFVQILEVMHPKNPYAPTVHFNYRYFETDAPEGVEGAPRQWWFGGGTDLTPSYVFEEDVKHFHMVQKQACDKFDPSFYPRFKKWCDDYFFIKHRGERRGLGGIFFDDLNENDQEMLLAFSTECTNSVIPAYIPLVEKRKDMPFTEDHKSWQQLRRGRYVEFNLVYDRGTTFGLKTGGRIESILMSLPLTARWEYDHQPVKGSEEWKLLDACINPKEWLQP